MNDKMPEFLLYKFTLSKTIVEKFPQDIKDFMCEYAKFYKWESTLKLASIFKLMKKGITYLPRCEYNGCNEQVKVKGKNVRLTRGCCMQHNLALSLIDSYGCENPMQSEIIKERLNKSNTLKYGCANPQQNKEIRERTKKTNIEKYGVEYYLQVKDFQEIKSNGMIEKHGVLHAQQSNKIREKTIKTNISKYGFSHPMKSDGVKKNLENSLFEKYGVLSVSHIPEIQQKMLHNSFKLKEFIWKTGEISMVQGYEPIVLKELEQAGYSFGDILTGVSNMPEIFYKFKDKIKRYFPDIYIPKENLIIEVKSEYTLNADLEINEAKFKATKDAGFNFRLEVR